MLSDVFSWATFYTLSGYLLTFFVSFPVGFTPEGLAVGLQIVGRHHDDFGVLQLANAFETASLFGERLPGVLQ